MPTRDVRFFIGAMKRNRHSPRRWFSSVTKQDLREVLSLIRRDGALTIRDIDDDVLVDKEHPWASRSRRSGGQSCAQRKPPSATRNWSKTGLDPSGEYTARNNKRVAGETS